MNPVPCRTPSNSNIAAAVDNHTFYTGRSKTKRIIVVLVLDLPNVICVWIAKIDSSMGIGPTTSVTLKDKEFSVAAIYAGNDEAANAFNEETGVLVYETDVSYLAACEAGVVQIVADFDPINALVNNAGVTRDCTLHRMTPTKWQEVININPGSCFNMSLCVISGMPDR